MAKDDKTIFDPGATKPEKNDETVYEGAVTVADSAATQFDDGSMTAAALSDAAKQTDAPASNLSIQKGDAILDTYKVESDAIEGGMGSVWRVHHTGWNTSLAMKHPQPKCFATEKSKADFIHECEAWINLGLHPNIVSCYYVREISGTPSIFSEWMDGGSLESAINKGTLYEGTETEQQERILDIAIQFARGLHYAHEAGLIHQDVKPDNLLLTKEGDAKVADFGLAKARAVLTVAESASNVQEATDSGKTIASPSGGYTPAYCSMEQMDGKELTRRTDIYSWAVSVMEMYVGSRPWANGVVAGLSCRGYFEDTKLPMPEVLKDLLAKCMEAELDDRPHDFAEIEATLQEIYKAETGTDYSRPAPKAAADTADSLNNRALSMLDLGKPEEAERLWKQALEVSQGNHLGSVYNQSLYLWRNARIDDTEALRRVRAVDSLESDQYISRLKAESGYWEGCQTELGDSSSKYKITSVAVSPNGKNAAIGREHLHSLKLWTLPPKDDTGVESSEECLLTESSPLRLRYSPDGSRLFVSDLSDVWLYDLSGRNCVTKFAVDRPQGTYHTVWCMDVSKDGRYLVTGGRTKTVNIFDIKTGTCVYALKGHKDMVRAVSISADGSKVLSGGWDQRLILWDTAQGICSDVACFDGEITAVCLNAAGTLALVGVEGEGLLLWSVTEWRQTGVLQGHTHKILHVAFSADETHALSRSWGQALYWDLRTRRCLQTFELHDDNASSIGENGSAIVADYYEATCWQLTDGTQAPWSLSVVRNTKEALDSDAAFELACTRAREAVSAMDIASAFAQINFARACRGHENDPVCSSLMEQVGRYCRKTGIRAIQPCDVINGVEMPTGPEGIQVNQDNTRLLLYNNEKLMLWDLEQHRFFQIIDAQSLFSGRDWKINYACMSGDGKAIFCSNYSQVKFLYPSDDGKVRCSNYQFPYEYGIGFVNKTLSKALFVCFDPGRTEMIDLHTNQVVRLLPEALEGIALSDDEKAFLYVDDDGALLYQPLSPKGTAKRFEGEVDSLQSFNRSGTMALAYADEETPVIYDVATCERLHSLTGHTDDVFYSEFSEDGRFVFTGSDSIVRVFDTTTGECLFVLSGVVAQTSLVSFTVSEDMRLLITAGYDQVVRLWKIEYDYEFPGFTDWDEEARPHLETFLTLHPAWTEDDFEGLILQLQHRGFGYIRPEGVRAKLAEMKPKKSGLFGKKK